MTWKIVLILSAVAWCGQAQFSGNGSCSVRTSHIDRALAALLENMPGELEITDEKEVQIFRGLFLGRTYLRGFKQMDSVKPYLVYCNPRFIVVFEVEKSEDHSGVLLRAKELRPVWMEKFMVRLEGLGAAVSTASSVIGVLFSQVARHYWAVVLEHYGLRALRAAAQQL